MDLYFFGSDGINLAKFDFELSFGCIELLLTVDHFLLRDTRFCSVLYELLPPLRDRFRSMLLSELSICDLSDFADLFSPSVNASCSALDTTVFPSRLTIICQQYNIHIE